jgi:carbon-monoxide dehydrogenase large subunit
MMSAADYAGLRAEQAALKARGQRMGIGMAGIVEAAGIGPSREMAGGSITKTGIREAGRVRIHPDGRATLSVGTHSHGQSHEITFRQVAADGLGIDIGAIDFQQGDTDRDPGDFGTGAARSLSTAGIALAIASKRIVAKATTLAAHLMECPEADIDYRDGVFTIRDTDRGRTFAQVAEMAYHGGDYPADGFELGLESTVNFDPVAASFPTALHLATVMVDVETGVVRLDAYHAVDDCGRVVNPLIVHGQIHGGLGQGIGQAMIEHMAYEPGSGQLLTGSFMDYAMPRADDLPSFELSFQETLCPSNPLGVKGCSETGASDPPAAIGNAIVDACWDLGLRHLDQPYTPERVWRALRASTPSRS